MRVLEEHEKDTCGEGDGLVSFTRDDVSAASTDV